MSTFPKFPIPACICLPRCQALGCHSPSNWDFKAIRGRPRAKQKEEGSAALWRNEALSLPCSRSERPMPHCPPSTPPYPAVLAKLHVCAGIRATGTKVYKSRDPLSARLLGTVPKPYPQITASSRPAPARADSSPRRGPAIGLSNGRPMGSRMGCKGLSCGAPGEEGSTAAVTLRKGRGRPSGGTATRRARPACGQTIGARRCCSDAGHSGWMQTGCAQDSPGDARFATIPFKEMREARRSRCLFIGTPAAPSCAADLSVPPDVPPHRAVPGPVTGGKQGAQGEADGSCSVPVLVILVVS
ncbi:poly(rC)-binding protein 3 isoform X23 [Meleagris gallopavo]|uniref:poly(rC)-binding protein 3 isoform X23 n=1 Tax=Meleagris gallopavo TaxID=9103 RepID=UPI0012AB8D29|nr:poly(rC)-binding protein 3 isoform X23 [Meleagris gallopavo]